MNGSLQRKVEETNLSASRHSSRAITALKARAAAKTTRQANHASADIDNADIRHNLAEYTLSPDVTRPRRSVSDGAIITLPARSNKESFEEQDETKYGLNDLTNDLDLEEWFEGVSDDLVDLSHSKYQSYYEELQLSRLHLDRLLEDTDSSLALLSTLSDSFKTVELQTSSFQQRCEDLLSEQKRLSALADNIGDNLQFYDLLDPITKRLNAPGAGHFVRGEDFSEMLYNLDRCREYMAAHPKHREAATYQAKYKQLLTRALTLIRVHFTNSLREVAADVAKRVSEQQLSDTTMSALLYAKFRVGAPELKRLGYEIQQRAAPPPSAPREAQGEYQGLMNELYQSYSAARGRLIVPLISKKMVESTGTSSTSLDLVSFARNIVGYIRGMCFDEIELWHEWFHGDGGLYEFLEAICEPLYDYLRPRTIHETQLSKLCEMCSLIQVRYMEGHDDDDEPPDPSQVMFASLIRPALEDAQTRLVFLTLSVLRDEIERFKPKPDDLDYPGRRKKPQMSGTKSKEPVLSGRKESTPVLPVEMRKTPKMGENENSDTTDLPWRYGSGTTYSEWYPTLRKAIWLLGKIYRLVKSTVFDDLAHQIVHQTTLSLHKAADLVKSKTSSPVDAQMFLLKQLLILKQQIVAFDIEFVTPEVDFDFSNVTNTFWELRARGALFNPRNLLSLVGGGLMPRVVENMLDAKAELDARLRTVINDFTVSFANRMTLRLSQEKAKQNSKVDAGASAESVRRDIEKEVPLLRAQLEAYIEDDRIKETLVGAVQDQVLHNYEDFFEMYTQSAKEKKGVPKNGKGREDEVWDPDTFADWTNTVFAVHRADYAGDEDEDGDMSPRRSDSDSDSDSN